jgi:Glyoxalase/Bleomycin resistance protein/Dioxygenase superfamily
MNEFGLAFHHFGLAVRDPKKSFLYLAALGYRDGAACFDPHQRVNLAMRHHDSMPDVEVIWPGSEPSPIDKMLKQRSGIVYHLCYTSADVAGSVAALEAAGVSVRQISVPVPAPLFEGLDVSFYSVPDFGIIEIIQTRTV